MYVIRNKSNGLYLGTTQTEQGYHQSWNASESLIKFETFDAADLFATFEGYDMLSGVDFEVVSFKRESLIGKIQKGILIGAACLLLLSGFAHVNYLNALRAASVCCGSDGCIQEAMNGYGFKVDALEVDSPTMAVKVVALWDSSFN